MRGLFLIAIFFYTLGIQGQTSLDSLEVVELSNGRLRSYIQDYIFQMREEKCMGPAAIIDLVLVEYAVDSVYIELSNRGTDLYDNFFFVDRTFCIGEYDILISKESTLDNFFITTNKKRFFKIETPPDEMIILFTEDTRLQGIITKDGLKIYSISFCK